MWWPPHRAGLHLQKAEAENRKQKAENRKYGGVRRTFYIVVRGATTAVAALRLAYLRLTWGRCWLILEIFVYLGKRSG